VCTGHSNFVPLFRPLFTWKRWAHFDVTHDTWMQSERERERERDAWWWRGRAEQANDSLVHLLIISSLMTSHQSSLSISFILSLRVSFSEVNVRVYLCCFPSHTLFQLLESWEHQTLFLSFIYPFFLNDCHSIHRQLLFASFGQSLNLLFSLTQFRFPSLSSTHLFP